MRRVTLVFVDSFLSDVINEELLNDEELELLFISSKDIVSSIEKAQGKYISFICNRDRFSEDYVDLLYQKSFEEFDCCYINNKVELEGFDHVRRNETIDYLKTLKPYYLEYIWQYMFKTDVLRKIIKLECNSSFDENIDEIVKEMTAIDKVIYFHDPEFNGEYDEENCDYLRSSFDDFPYVDFKYI